MKKGDLWLVIMLLVVLAGFIVPTILKSDDIEVGHARALYEAKVTVNGELVRTVALGEAHEEIHIETAHGVNVLNVFDYGIQMQEADCPDKLCMLMGTKTMPGETIVCLPHRLMVEIVDPLDKGDGLDAIVQ